MAKKKEKSYSVTEIRKVLENMNPDFVEEIISNLEKNEEKSETFISAMKKNGTKNGSLSVNDVEQIVVSKEIIEEKITLIKEEIVIEPIDEIIDEPEEFIVEPIEEPLKIEEKIILIEEVKEDDDNDFWN